VSQDRNSSSRGNYPTPIDKESEEKGGRCEVDRIIVEAMVMGISRIFLRPRA
jgi:hypothetical protein